MEIINSQMLTTVDLERCLTWGGCDGNGGGDSCAGLTVVCPSVNVCWVDCISAIVR